MDAGLVMNVLALTVSAIAVAISAVFAMRQLRKTEISNNTLVTLELLARERRTDEYLESEDFVLHHLRTQYPPELGVDALPIEARKHVIRVGLYYNSLGQLLAFRAVDEALLISTVNYRTRQVWAILEPYVRAERAARKGAHLAYFEHLACVATRLDSSAVHQKLNLLTFDPTTRVEPPISNVTTRGPRNR